MYDNANNEIPVENAVKKLVFALPFNDAMSCGSSSIVKSVEITPIV